MTAGRGGRGEFDRKQKLERAVSVYQSWNKFQVLKIYGSEMFFNSAFEKECQRDAKRRWSGEKCKKPLRWRIDKITWRGDTWHVDKNMTRAQLRF